MQNNSSRLFLTAGIGLAVAALCILNVMAQRFDPKYQEKLEQERMVEAQKKAAEQAAKNPSPAPGASPVENRLVELGEERILGNPSGKSEITLVWEYTPTVQADPSLVYNVIDQIKKAAPDSKIRVVNGDVNGDLPTGISVKGQLIAPAAPDGKITVDEHAIQDAVSGIEHPEHAIPRMPGPGVEASPAPAAMPPGAAPAPETPVVESPASPTVPAAPNPPAKP
jgi:hypothetical protein